MYQGGLSVFLWPDNPPTGRLRWARPTEGSRLLPSVAGVGRFEGDAPPRRRLAPTDTRYPAKGGLTGPDSRVSRCPDGSWVVGMAPIRLGYGRWRDSIPTSAPNS